METHVRLIRTGFWVAAIAVLVAYFAGRIPAQQALTSATAVVLVLSLLLFTCYRTRKA